MKKIYLLIVLLALINRVYGQQAGVRSLAERVKPGFSVYTPVNTSFESATDTVLSYVRAERLLSAAYARTGEASLLLNGQNGKAYFVSSRLIPVAPAQRAVIKVYATYTSGSKPVEKLLQAVGVSAAAYNSSRPMPALQEQQSQNCIRKLLPYLGLGITANSASHIRLKNPTRAYLRYLLYNADTVLVSSAVAQVDRSAENNWQELTLTTNAPVKGFLQVVFLNEGRELVRADDFTVQVSEAGNTPALYSTRYAAKYKYKGRFADVLGLTNSFGCQPEECDPNNPDLEDPDLFCQCYPFASDCDGSHPVYPPCNPNSYDPQDCHCGIIGDPHSPPCPTGVDCNTNWQPYSNEWCQCHPQACNETPPNPNPGGGGGSQGGGGTPVVFDCTNTPNGSAHVDACGTCVGGTTGKVSLTFYQDADNDSWGNPSVIRVCYNPGPGWVLKGGDYNDHCYDSSNDPSQCICNNPSFSPYSVGVIQVAPDASTPTLGGKYGQTWPEGTEIEIDVCRDGNVWRAILTTLILDYSIQVQLPPGVSEVSNTNAGNFCAQVADLHYLGDNPNGTSWYMLSAVEAHENAHVDYLRQSLVDVSPTAEAIVEAYTIPYNPGQTKWNATMQLEQMIRDNNVQQQLRNLVLSTYVAQYAVYVHSSTGPAAQAEHQVVDPVANSICSLYQSSQNTSQPWPLCPDCP